MLSLLQQRMRNPDAAPINRISFIRQSAERGGNCRIVLRLQCRKQFVPNSVPCESTITITRILSILLTNHPKILLDFSSRNSQQRPHELDVAGQMSSFRDTAQAFDPGATNNAM